MAVWNDRIRDEGEGGGRCAAPAPDPEEDLAKAAIGRVLDGDDDAVAVVVHSYGATVAQALGDLE